MPGERDLQVLLSGMNPHLSGGEFVFCSYNQDDLGPIQPIATFRESEGISAIVAKQEADDEGLQYSYIARMIKLDVHSSLDSAGFIAAITGRLAQADISVNPVSAYFHDYLFVPRDQADETMCILTMMMNEVT